MFGFKSPPAAEPPPPGYAGPAPGTTVSYLQDPTAVFLACRAALGRLPQAGTWYNGCFVPQTHTEIMLDPAKTSDKQGWQELKDHEDAHTWGLVHDQNGHGWFNRDGTPAQPLTPDQIAMMRSVAQAQTQAGASIPPLTAAQTAQPLPALPGQVPQLPNLPIR